MQRFKKGNGMSTFGFVMVFNGTNVGAYAIKGPRMCLSKEAKTGAIFFALNKAKEKKKAFQRFTST